MQSLVTKEAIKDCKGTSLEKSVVIQSVSNELKTMPLHKNYV